MIFYRSFHHLQESDGFIFTKHMWVSLVRDHRVYFWLRVFPFRHTFLRHLSLILILSEIYFYSENIFLQLLHRLCVFFFDFHVLISACVS